MAWIRSGGATATLLLVAGLTAACSSTTTSSGTNSTTTTASTTTTSSTAAGGGGGTATITSVVFSGSVTAPTVTVNGSGLGSMPTPNPTYTPEGTQLCPLAASGNEGYDYGTDLYLFDSPRNWAGGRYRPELQELDCVGLLVTTFTPTKVVFQFGSAYTKDGAKNNYVLAEGDAYQLAVNGATFTGTVNYTQG